MANSRPRRCAIGLAVLVAVVLAVGWVGVRPLMQRYLAYGETIADLNDRIGRFREAVAHRDELRQKLQAVQETNDLEKFYLGEATPALAAARLQERLKGVVKSSGGRLVSTQALPVRESEGMRRIAVRTRVDGDVVVLRDMLHALEAGNPILFIDNLTVRAKKGSREDSPYRGTPLIIQFDVEGYQLREGA